MLKSSSSTRAGMGAIPYQGGTAFRVWAPFASKVSVAGDFNNWSATDDLLASEGNGYWSVDVPGAMIDQKYKYVINDGSNPPWRSDPHARQIIGDNRDSVIIDSNVGWWWDTYEMPAWNQMVIYELHIGTFNDLPGDLPGDIESVVEKLDHLQDLGINAIELMPLVEFNSDFSWGYNPSRPYAIEDVYGGFRAFKRLVKEAHARGIAVIQDVVYNHFGPEDLDIWQFDGWNKDGKGGIYFYNDWRSWTPWGETRPDYGRSEVRQYIRDNALMWLEECEVDGLRWDSTIYMRNVYGKNNDPDHDIADAWWLMQRINNEINGRYPDKISIAEDLQDNDWITKSTGSGGAGFDAQWFSGFSHSVRGAIITSDDKARNMHDVANAIQHRRNGDAFQQVIYTESHDEVANYRSRVPHEIWPDEPGSWYSRKRSTIGAALVFTTPGIPMIFQGQEILEDEWFRDADPIEWSKKDKYSGIFQTYRDLIQLRRNWHNNTRGLRGQHVNVHHINNEDKVIAFHRWENGGPGDDVIVVANMANRSYQSYRIGFPRGGSWKVRFNSDSIGYSPDFGNHPGYDTTANSGDRDGMRYSGDVGIGPYSVIMLSQDG
ncbi:alpha-amylase family glycosyl hydrolase [Candidatus Poribacteria bacterium]